MTSKKSTIKGRTSTRNEAFLQKIGARLQFLMDQQGITHEIFYADTSINPHRIISGKTNMTMSTFSRICEYLKIEPTDFFKKI
jgi:DNA-binding Xre family transcriptional regulator